MWKQLYDRLIKIYAALYFIKKSSGINQKRKDYNLYFNKKIMHYLKATSLFYALYR